MRYTFEMAPKRSFGLGKLLVWTGVAAGAYYAYQYLTDKDSYTEFTPSSASEAEPPVQDDGLTERILRAAKRIRDDVKQEFNA